MGPLNNSGNLTNTGTLNNNDLMTNTGTLTHNSSSLYNAGNLINDNLLNINSFLENSNSGTLTNNSNSMLNNNDQVNNYGLLTNNGDLTNNDILYNRGTLTNNGALINTSDLRNFNGAILNIGTGGSSGTLSGNITNQGSLTFNRSDDSPYSDIISGSGSLTKDGQGAFTLSGVNTYNGATTVNNGELKVNGSISSSSLTTVNSGAIISGTGIVGALTINSGGFIAPGNSIGTLTVNGPYIQHGIYNCEVQAAPASTIPGTDNDVINITGSADITNGTLNVIPLAGNYVAGQTYTYTILSSAGPLNGPFATITGSSPLFTYTMTYDTNNAYLHLLSSKKREQAISIGNPGQVASYVNSNGSQALINQLNPLTTSQLKQAFNQLSPAASTQVSDMTANIELSHMDVPFAGLHLHRDKLLKDIGETARQLISNLTSFKQSFAQFFTFKLNNKKLRFSSLQDTDVKHLPVSAEVDLGKASLWIQGAGSRFSQGNIADPSGLSVSGLEGMTYDTTIGINYALPTVKLGLVSGYNYSTYKMKVDGDKGNKNSGRIGLYGLWEPTLNGYIKGSVYYGHHRFKGERIMTVIPAVAHQKHNGHHVSGLVEVGRDITLPRSVILTPYFSAGALYLHENGYREIGADIQNLAVKSRHSTTLQGKGGFQLVKLWNGKEDTQVYSFVRLGATYRRTVGRNQKVWATLVGQGGQFTVNSKNKRRLMINPSVGVTAFLAQSVSTTLGWKGEIGSTQQEHQIVARVDWNF
ncbi:hypothetical protein ID47_02020 [Candidatus Paracaedibacter acanthamoebae]|uniref:Autotransporter domain-containing protein n=2 Tax=Candidatus Odyssella acanthamoebae TaxID=91604 RepID=A0A077ATQ6_9PROT|nr:hypothetical protein ID47_02020 [Candidatus Paracaedibacter acanthamoebae]